MPFMLIILVFLMVTTVWALFHTNPQGVDARVLLIYNAVTLALAVPVAIGGFIRNAFVFPQRKRSALLADGD